MIGGQVKCCDYCGEYQTSRNMDKAWIEAHATGHDTMFHGFERPVLLCDAFCLTDYAANPRESVQYKERMGDKT